ncbi:MAG: hypothetical protein HYZ68_02175 [Chloroflexi bacterium]|nr:hypothetical protein [Chloroflexota bacterium]
MAVGRFQVMAILQAARAYTLGLPEESAKSFGLNRAIFYSAAKRGFIGGERKKGPPSAAEVQLPRALDKKKAAEIRKSFKVHQIGDEIGYGVEIEGKPFFIMGNEVQTSEAFERQVARRFGKTFDKAWKEALRIVKRYDQGVLLSQRYFYETIYKPRRDELATQWTQMAEESES